MSREEGKALMLRLPFTEDESSEAAAAAEDAWNELAFTLGRGILLSDTREEAEKFFADALLLVLDLEKDFKLRVDTIGEEKTAELYTALVEDLSEDIENRIQMIGEEES